jgi:hypothetical protein
MGSESEHAFLMASSEDSRRSPSAGEHRRDDDSEVASSNGLHLTPMVLGTSREAPRGVKDLRSITDRRPARRTGGMRDLRPLMRIRF